MKQLKTIFLAIAIILGISLSSCSSEDDDNNNLVKSELQIKTITDLDGSKLTGSGSIYFSLKTGLQVTGTDTLSNKWDIKFKGTTVAINSGISGTGSTIAQVVNSTFESLIEAPEAGYKSDAAGAIVTSSWYSYTGQSGTPPNAILPVPGKIIVLKTADGKYAKLEMISYYKGNPNTSSTEFASFTTRPPARYYTFRYALQLDGTRKLN